MIEPHEPDPAIAGTEYISIFYSVKGWKTVRMFYSEPDPEVGKTEESWEPWEIGETEHHSFSEAMVEARYWAEDRRLPVIDPNSNQITYDFRKKKE